MVMPFDMLRGRVRLIPQAPPAVVHPGVFFDPAKQRRITIARDSSVPNGTSLAFNLVEFEQTPAARRAAAAGIIRSVFVQANGAAAALTVNQQYNVTVVFARNGKAIQPVGTSRLTWWTVYADFLPVDIEFNMSDLITLTVANASGVGAEVSVWSEGWYY